MLSWLQEWLPGNRQEDTPGQRSHDSDYVEPYPHSDDKEAGELGQEQKAVVQNTAFRVSRLILDGATTFQICDIIRRCPYKHQLLSERDFYGYNALQYAVICARVDLMLEMVRFGADINLPICGRPLHLACKLGHADIVKALLSHGADPQVVACVCYPYHHTKAGFTYSNKREKWSLSCIGDVYSSEHSSDILFDFPLYYALLSHNVECVQILINKQYSQASFLRHGHPVHLVCEIGAMNVLQYLCQLSKETEQLTNQQQGHLMSHQGQSVTYRATLQDNVNQRDSYVSRSVNNGCSFHLELDLNKLDSHGYSPLHYAVRWGRNITEYLVLHGANVQIKTKTEQTVLHVLFSGAVDRWITTNSSKKAHKRLCSSSVSRSVHDVTRAGIPAELPSGMVECTRYLLSCGLQMNINALDKNGNSALHCLMNLVHMNLCGKDGVRSEERQSLWITTVQECVVALLQAHINPNIPNKAGDTCLHLLLTKPSVEITSKETEAISNRFIYNLPGIVPVLGDLLKHGAKPNMINNSEATGMELLLRQSVERLFGQAPGKWKSPDKSEVASLIGCLKLLYRYGYSFDDPIQGQIHLQLVLSQITKIDHLTSYQAPGTEFSATQQRHLVTEFVSAILDVTQALLECGCNPNMTRPLKQTEGLVHQCHSLHLAYYLLMNRQAAVPLQIVHRCVLLLLRYGVDPNRDGEHVPLSVIHPYGYEVRSVYPLLHILNVIGSPHKAHSRENLVYLYKLFDVLYNCMDDRVSRQCVRNYLNYDRLHMSRLWVPHAHRLVFGFYNINDNNDEDDDDAHIDDINVDPDFHGNQIPGQQVAMNEELEEIECFELLGKHADFHCHLDRLLHNTRSLKQLSRLAVVSVLNHELMNVQNLPLPATLKSYVLTFSM